MAGLIYKDFCLMSKSGKMLLLMLAIFGVVGIFQGEPGFFLGMIEMLMIILPVNCFSYDRAAEWDAFVAASPVGRQKAVAARYLWTFIISALGAMSTLLLGFAATLIHPEILFREILWSGGFGLSVSLFAMGVMMPIIYKYGVEKSRMVMMLLFLIPFVTMMLVSSMMKAGWAISLPEISDAAAEQALIVVLPGVMLFYGLSYLLSVRVYNRKEM